MSSLRHLCFQRGAGGVLSELMWQPNSVRRMPAMPEPSYSWCDSGQRTGVAVPCDGQASGWERFSELKVKLTASRTDPSLLGVAIL